MIWSFLGLAFKVQFEKSELLSMAGMEYINKMENMAFFPSTYLK